LGRIKDRPQYPASGERRFQSVAKNFEPYAVGERHTFALIENFYEEA